MHGPRAVGRRPAGAGAVVRVGEAAEVRAVRLGELVQRLQAALNAQLHDAGRAKGGGLDSLITLSKMMLPHRTSSLRRLLSVSSTVLPMNSRKLAFNNSRSKIQGLVHDLPPV